MPFLKLFMPLATSPIRVKRAGPEQKDDQQQDDDDVDGGKSRPC
jgi:hypothetical protein